MKDLAFVVFGLVFACAGHAATCESEDYATNVSGESQCLRMRAYGATEHPVSMVVWLHGDVARGGPADYHFSSAQQLGQLFPNVLSVALVRPGYPDGSGKASTVDPAQSGRSDHYTRENLVEVGSAIQRLRERYRPMQVVVVGHSGGAATAAVLLAMKPEIMDAAVLVSCPCDIASWRQSRLFGRSWPRSEDPLKWADRVPVGAHVIAISGDRDDNTHPDLAKRYVDVLRARGIDARQVLVPWKGHDDAFQAPEVLDSIREMLKR